MRDEREKDEMIDRIVDELKVLPAVRADATARVLARVEAARRGDSGEPASEDDDVIYFPAATDEMRTMSPAAGRPSPVATSATGSRTAGGLRGLHRRFIVSLPAAVGYALAATLAGFLIRGALPRSGGAGSVANAPTSARVDDTALTTAPTAVTPVSMAASRAADEAPVPVQFVLDARRARSVALVGDFNAWDGSATPLARDSAVGTWTTVVDVSPGRHVYAFLVDGKTWTLDPRAPRVKDADYGAEQSVIVVGVR